MGSQSNLTLNVAIIGAGVAGLATGIALKRKGHTVTIYELNTSLSEFGAGIQLSANGTRIIHAYDLQDEFAAIANQPECMRLYRWQDHSLLGEIQHNPFETWRYGYPQWQIYRPDLQRLLYEGAVREGVEVVFGKAVVGADTDKGVITFKDGGRVEADLVVAADGIRSRTRAFLPQTKDVVPTPYKEHVYRAVIPAERMTADPRTAELMQGQVSMGWCGPETTVLGYRVAGGRLYNFLISVPRPNPDAGVARWNQPGDVAEMRALLDGWCSLPQILADKVDECAAWTLAQIDKVESYVSDSGRFALIGDAAHAILPHAGQGGNMALEDSASLAEFISSMASVADLPRAMQAWFKFRQDRVERLRRIAGGNAGMFTLQDGPAQEARDKSIGAQTQIAREELKALGMEGLKQKYTSEKVEQDPDATSILTPGGRAYVYSYDIFEESRIYIEANL